MFRCAFPICVVLIATGAVAGEPGFASSLSVQSGQGSNYGLSGVANPDPAMRMGGYAYRFPDIGTTEAEWIRPLPDGTVCVDVTAPGGNCDLRLRGETLLLMSVNRTSRKAAGKDRFRLRFELGVKP